ncbi:MAG: DUF2066 domain-containing protein [Reyranellaceae bacterium]
MRKIVSIAVLAAALLAGEARAIDPAGLYAGRTIVTGTIEPERGKGLRRIMLDVLIKAAAEPRLAEDPRVPALLERAPDYVTGFEYEDRMKGTPVRDEQGTRDRPHDLTARFDAAKIDAALAQLGLRPWNASRPTLTAFITVRFPDNQFVLAEDSQLGLGQKQALQAAAVRRGMKVVLGGATSKPMPGKEPANGPESYVLEGTLSWQPDTVSWRTDWLLASGRQNRRWSVETTSFDEAFRNGVGEAAATLAGRR